MTRSTRLLAAPLIVSAASFLLCTTQARPDSPPSIEAVLEALNGVHPFAEVALSPDGKRLVYARVVTGKRDGADVDVSALFIINARDGTGTVRLTACPGAVCDEHGATWSPDGTRIAFVTTDPTQQTQIASADASAGNAKTLTQAHGPVDTPRWSPDGQRIAFLYSQGAPKTPGPLNPLVRDAGVLSDSVYEQRLAVIPARGGEPILLGPANLNVYEYDWAPDGKSFAITAAHGSGDNNWWIAELDVLEADATRPNVRVLLKPNLQMASPRWSGDGRHIAYIGGIMSDESITGGDVYVIASEGGAPIDVTPGLAASVLTLTWNGSASHILATEFAAGESVLADIDVKAKVAA